ncbi:DUF3800 domain-containing protein [Trichormus azollae]|uniref:DUF3800 domain-containing protein n=1 Tax=Trichormus azollae TaxID=1164 RepID=UPI00325EC114
MYFTLVKVILSPKGHYRIYLDIKDKEPQGARKVAKLHDILSNNLLEFSRQIIEKLQTLRSHEVNILQLADLLIGSISYINRGLFSNAVKSTLVDRMREHAGYSLTKTTLYLEDKVNLLYWQPADALA